MASALELSTLGHRIRHHRVARGYTLDELGALVGVAGSQLSLIENGKREPKLSLLQAIAHATGTDVTDLLSPEPPNRRAALELDLEQAQNSPVFRRLGILSYGAYLWHFEYLFLANSVLGDAVPTGGLGQLAYLAGGLVFSFGAAQLSYRYVAQPMQALRHRFSMRGAASAPAE